MRRSAAPAAPTPRPAPPPAPARRPPPESTVRIPIAIGNEQVVLAAACVSAELRSKLVRALAPDRFHAKTHPEFWQALRDIEDKGLAFDPLTVAQLSGGAVSAEYAEQLVRDRPAPPANLMHHVQQIHLDCARIELVRGPVGSLLEALREPNPDVERLRMLCRQVGRGLDDAGGAARWLRDPNQLTRDTVAAVRARRGGANYHPFSVGGIDLYGPEDGDLNGTRRIVLGCAPTKTTVVTGTPGSGKTVLAIALAVAQANLGRRVLYGAWEMEPDEMLELCAAHSLGLSRAALSTGDVTDEELARLEQECDRLGGHIRFADLPFDRGKAEKRVNDRAMDLVHQLVIDAAPEVCIFDLWRRAARKIEPDEEELALYRQQAIAKETRTHCVLVHQQRAKDVEQRQDKRPTREGLKGSGAWFEVPDLILGVHREALWKDVPDDKLEVDIIKQRAGRWPLAVEFDWDPLTMSIMNGRSIPYVRAGSSGGEAAEGFLDGNVQKRGRRRG